MQSSIDRVARRLLKAVGRGWKTTGNDSGNVQTVQVRFSPGELIDNMPRLVEFGFTSNPPVGSDVVALFLAGDRSNGVVIGTGHQQSRPKNLKPGETMIYCLDGKSIYLTAAGGIVINANDQAVTINNATTVTVNAVNSINLETPTVNVSQNLNVGQNLVVSGITTTGQLDVG